jgi:glycosyltransferase involved in cell wall biosynthesis
LNWNDKIVVVSVRKHEPIYAVDTLIRAIPIVLARSSDVRFMVFGSGTQTSRLIRLAEELKAEQFVHFSGTVPRDKLLAHVKGCDIYVSTSLSDGTSSSLVEAMVLGVPVVVTSITGNAEWISDNVNGLMFQEEDSEGLARIIIDLARNSANRDRLAAAAMKHLRERVKWETASAELIRRMRDLLI